MYRARQRRGTAGATAPAAAFPLAGGGSGWVVNALRRGPCSRRPAKLHRQCFTAGTALARRQRIAAGQAAANRERVGGTRLELVTSTV
jgi:hypothetical protein